VGLPGLPGSRMYVYWRSTLMCLHLMPVSLWLLFMDSYRKGVRLPSSLLRWKIRRLSNCEVQITQVAHSSS